MKKQKRTAREWWLDFVEVPGALVGVLASQGYQIWTGGAMSVKAAFSLIGGWIVASAFAMLFDRRMRPIVTEEQLIAFRRGWPMHLALGALAGYFFKLVIALIVHKIARGDF